MYLILHFFIIKCIDLYRIIINILPIFIYIKQYNYKYVDILEYKCRYNERYYTLKFLDFGNIDKNIKNFKKNIKERIKQRYLLNNVCLIDCDGHYIKDITEDFRSFMHYIPLSIDNDPENITLYINSIYKLKKKEIIWKHINLNIHNSKCNILISFNDLNLTELII